MKHAESSYSVPQYGLQHTGLPPLCSCPLHAFAHLKKTLCIYTPLFFQMLKDLSTNMKE